jgi:hypothetical protein
MEVKLHKNSRTTPRIRQEIKDSEESISALAKKYSLDWRTVKKWKVSESIEDKSSRPKMLRTDLTEHEEEMICFHRKQFKSTIDEIYVAVKDQIKGKEIYPMKIYRCLRRHNLNVLPKELKEAERKIKKFKNYGIGYLHIDFIFSKRFEGRRYYVFTCIDRVSKLAYVMLTNSRKVEESVRFLEEVIAYYPYKINYILTDNGSEFNSNASKNHPTIKAKKVHRFVETCRKNKIVYRATKFKHPWTNGMVERFNRKIKEKVIQLRYFKDIDELAKELVKYINEYNYKTKLKALSYQSPVEYLKKNDKIKQTKLLKQTLTTYRY